MYVSGGSAQAIQTGTTNSSYPIGSLVGTVNITQTLINGAGTINVPLTFEADSLGVISGSASLGVMTAEAASVQDTKAYAPIGVAFSPVNVGWAATGGVSTTNSNVQTFGAPLSAYFAAGSQISPSPNGASLTSIVGVAGTAGSNSTATGQNGSTLSSTTGAITKGQGPRHGRIGVRHPPKHDAHQQCEHHHVLANRNNAENGSFLDPTWSTQLPSGVQWLASDVVDIPGVPSDLTYAMEMSYDDRINTTLDSDGLPEPSRVRISAIRWWQMRSTPFPTKW